MRQSQIVRHPGGWTHGGDRRPRRVRSSPPSQPAGEAPAERPGELALAEHTDLLIDFSDLAPGTELTLWNIRAARESSLLQDVGRHSAEPGLSSADRGGLHDEVTDPRGPRRRRSRRRQLIGSARRLGTPTEARPANLGNDRLSAEQRGRARSHTSASFPAGETCS